MLILSNHTAKNWQKKARWRKRGFFWWKKERWHYRLARDDEPILPFRKCSRDFEEKREMGSKGERGTQTVREVKRASQRDQAAQKVEGCLQLPFPLHKDFQMCSCRAVNSGKVWEKEMDRRRQKQRKQSGHQPTWPLTQTHLRITWHLIQHWPSDQVLHLYF